MSLKEKEVSREVKKIHSILKPRQLIIYQEEVICLLRRFMLLGELLRLTPWFKKLSTMR